MVCRLVLSLLFLAALGCSHLKGPFHPVEGRVFAVENLDQIYEGMVAAEVLQILGEPLERMQLGDSEAWRYYIREERVDEKRLLGLAKVRRWRWERWSKAEILIESGRVADLTYDSEVVLPK